MSRGLHVAALALGVPGFAIQVYGLYGGQPFLALCGAVLLVAGLMCYSWAKGYAPAWGLWGLVPVMGPIILVLQPHRTGSTVEETIDRLLIEEDPRIRAANPREADTMSGGRPLLAIMIPIGVLIMLFCGGLPKATAPALETAPATLAPAQPTPAPTPAPRPKPESPPEAVPRPAATPARDKPKSAEEKYAALEPGMTYEEVCAVVGSDATPISGKIGSNAILKWRNPDKSYFAVRFRGGRLDRMTHLVAPPLEKKNEEMLAELEPQSADVSVPPNTAAAAQEPPPPNELPGLAEAEAAAAAAAEGGPPEAPPSEATPPAESSDTPVAKTRKNVVRVGESAKPTARVRKARLPKYTQVIAHGPHDVHIINPYDYDVKVGVRGLGKRGKNLSIPARAEAALYLPNGEYSVHYTDDRYPERLNYAGSFTVDSPLDAIVIVLH